MTETLTVRVLASKVSGCLLDSLVHEKYLILGKKTPYNLVCDFPLVLGAVTLFRFTVFKTVFELTVDTVIHKQITWFL